ncbi:MAG: hypothetical protein U1G07_15635 [Verrucomicrobiota bacterium]
MLAKQFDVSADVWSATSYKLLRNDNASGPTLWNRLRNRAAISPISKSPGPRARRVLAVSDYMIVPDQIAPWVPGGLTTLGTDGFGRSDTRPNLRRFFEVDAEMTVVATLDALARKGELGKEVVAKAIRELGVDPEKASPHLV